MTLVNEAEQDVEAHVDVPESPNSPSKGGMFKPASGIGSTVFSFVKSLCTPKRSLFFMFFINLMIYFDRGAIAASLETLSDDFGLNPTEQGIVGAAFMLGYLVMAPLFGQWSRYIRIPLLMFSGMLVWIASVLFTGVSIEFFTLTASRTLAGVGEASFAGLAPTYVDDIAPPPRRTLWLAIFYSAVPIGAALGYAVAGTVAQFLSWRFTFFGEGLIMIPCILVCYFMPTSEDVVKDNKEKMEAEKGIEATQDVSAETVDGDVGELDSPTKSKNKNKAFSFEEDQEKPKKAAADSDDLSITVDVDNAFTDTSSDSLTITHEEEPSTENITLWMSIWEMLCNAEYMLIVSGYASLVFVMGSLYFWAPTYLSEEFGLDPMESGLIIGLLTVVNGFLGTGFGGWFVDYLGGGSLTATRCILIMTTLSVPSVVAFVVNDFTTFLLLITFAEFFLFAVTSPINSLCMLVVPQHHRSFAMTMQICIIHLFGDFPSPIVIGFIKQYWGLKTSMLVLCLGIFVAILFFLWMWFELLRKKSLEDLDRILSSSTVAEEVQPHSDLHLEDISLDEFRGHSAPVDPDLSLPELPDFSEAQSDSPFEEPL